MLFRKFSITLFATCFALAMMLAAAPPIAAQGTTSGGFIGLVKDLATGNPIPGATVRLRNRGTGTQATVITEADGKFSEGPLPPGEYDIEVSAPGYNSVTKQQKLYTMQNYTVLPDPFEMATVSAVVTPPVTVDPGRPAPTPAPPVAIVINDDNEGGGEGIGLNSRRVGIFDDAAVVGLSLGSTTLTRTFDELAFLVPGVNLPPQAIGNSVGPGVGAGVGTSGQFSVNGLRSRANNFTVDGSDNNDEDIGVRRQGFFSLVPQPIESIQEYQITTLLAPAEFGRNLGAQVNAVSKSGGNRFHGSVFGFLNDDVLNARNFFDNASGNTTVAVTGRNSITGTLIPVEVDGVRVNAPNNAGEEDEFRLLQGGFAIGGPIRRDRTFFFVSGEGQRLNGTQERHYAVPTVEQRGLFNSGATGLTTTGGTPVFPTSLGGDDVFSFFPFANDPGGVYGRNTYSQALSIDAKGLILSGKVDHNFSFRTRPQVLTVRYNFTDDERDLPDVGGALFSSIRPLVRTHNISAYLNGGLTDSISNELRFSFGRTDLNFEELRDTTGFMRPIAGRFNSPADTRFLLNARVLGNYTRPGGTPGCSPGVVCYLTNLTSPGNEVAPTTELSGIGLVGQVIVSGFSPVGVDVFNFPQERTNNTLQFADTVRWQTGDHSVAFGTDIRKTNLKSNLPRNSRPLVTFNGSPNFLGAGFGFTSPTDLAAAGGATGFFQSLVLPGRDASIELAYYQLDFFLQDEWRVTPRITLSLGGRYEYNTTPREANDKIENALIQPLPARVSGFGSFVDGRDKIFESDSNNFAPRLGLAIDLGRRSVLRAGAGVYYDQILGSVVSQSRNVFPTFTTVNFGGGLPSCFDSAGNPAVCGSPQEDFNRRRLFLNLFNPLNSAIGTTPVILPGTINTLNPAFVGGSAPMNSFLNTIFFNFPAFAGTPFGATLPRKELETPLAYQYSIGMETEIFNNTFFSAAYVGTSGRNLLRFTTPNLGQNYVIAVTNFAASGSVPSIEGISLDPLGRPVSNIGPISQFETTGRSQYHSLQVGMRGRFARRLQYAMNYIWGKVEDDVSDVFDLAGASALPQNSLTFGGEYGPANFDVRHRFTYNFAYDTPSLQDRGGIARAVLGGWQIAGTGKFNTGQPFTVNSIYDVNLDGNLTDRLNNTAFINRNGDRRAPLTLTCTTPAQCQSMLAPFGSDGGVRRNSFRAGSNLDLDIAVSKRFRFRETQDIQFRMDIFNFIDRANFGVPVRFLEAPGFGSAVETLSPGRRIQFGLKYNF